MRVLIWLTWLLSSASEAGLARLLRQERISAFVADQLPSKIVERTRYLRRSVSAESE